jgi:hypothetical protein
MVANTRASVNLTDWYKWNTIYTNTTTTNLVWNEWIVPNTTTISTGNVIWNDWVINGIIDRRSFAYNGVAGYSLEMAVPPSAAWNAHPQDEWNAHTQDEWAEIRRRHDAQAAERDKVNAAARVEGSRLLAMVLNEAQQATLEAGRYFDLVGASGQRWRVRYGTSGNVLALDDDGREIMAICAHPRIWDDNGGYLPTEDVLVGQALHLIHDDSTFLAKANVHRGDRWSPALAPALRAA